MKLLTIFGNPVSHSKSPLMHNFAIKEFGEDAKYTRTRLDDGKDIKKSFDTLGLDGANVTVPFKEDAYKLVDEVVGIAQKIGAINTIVKRDGKLYGYNTDAEGFYQSVCEFGEIKKALIIGAGGTAKSIATIFDDKKIAFDVLNRSIGRLEFFKELECGRYSWDTFEVSEYDLIINTTSAGLSDDSYPLDENLLKSLFEGAKGAIDVIYGKETPFLKLAKSYDLPTKDGEDMLLYQGVLAFDKFFDSKYSLEDITKNLREGLSLAK
jgi:shikimate dehydrogenase